MGKRIASQARGRGGPAYRVRRKAYRYRIKYPELNTEGNAKIIKLINSGAHTAPLAKIIINNKIFYNAAADGIYEGQGIEIGKSNTGIGNILKLKDIPIGAKIFNIEVKPGDGGKYVRTSGGFATISNQGEKVTVLLKKRRIELNKACRATIGVVAGEGRLEKPILKAGKKHYMMKAKGRLWHRTSAVKVNAVDHPFGSGRGKRIKSKIAKRNAPPGAKVGHIRPRRTGRRK